MVILLRKKVLYMASAALLLTAAAALTFRSFYAPASFTVPVEQKMIYVIDAGHGGEDGGAVAADGTVESAINLAVSARLDALLRLLGQETHMTRATDRALYGPEATTLREKKSSDLKNRVELVNGFERATLLSIHQNSLPSSARVHGAQAFYGKERGSEELAEAIQLALNQAINAGNEKSKKTIPDSVYLMKHVNCRAVLIECGFLSNPEETEWLKAPAHQQKLALAIAAGVLTNETSGERGDP